MQSQRYKGPCISESCLWPQASTGRPKRTEQNLIPHIGKSEAKVTNNKRLCLTTDRNEESLGLSATAEFLILKSTVTYFQTCARWPPASHALRPWRWAEGTLREGFWSLDHSVCQPATWQRDRQSSPVPLHCWSYSTGPTGRWVHLQCITSSRVLLQSGLKQVKIISTKTRSRRRVLVI